MPWKETERLNERKRFIEAWMSKVYNVVELSERFDISEKTAWKWIGRFKTEGLSGLEDRSRAPKSSPHQVKDFVVEMILEERRRHPFWGARKILARLKEDHPETDRWPAASTVSALFKRHGLVEEQKKRRRHRHPGSAPAVSKESNEIWTTDFKGQFPTGDGVLCYPLTIADHYSRFILMCEGLYSTSGGPVREAFERVFYEFGLPRAIRSDNGTPFAGNGVHGFSKLNIWWMKLGISHQRSRPGHPQDNGVHERMHRTLKQETCKPPEKNLKAQQASFDAFVEEFNHERPHEALGYTSPSAVYRASEREYDGTVPDPEYPGYYLVKKITKGGTFRFKNELLFLSSTLEGEWIGLEEVDDRVWAVYFYDFLIGKLTEDPLVRHW